MKGAVLLLGLSWLFVGLGACGSENDVTEPSTEELSEAARRCVSGQTRCSGSNVQVCGTNGRWGALIACASGTCANGVCSVCAPGTSRCSGNAVQICGANGQWGGPVTCASGACINGVCSICVPGSSRCSGNAVQICGANGTFGSLVPCAASQVCTAGVCTN